MKKFLIVSFVSFLTGLFFFISCGRRPLAPPIGNNLSFPGAMAALNSNNFLLLNTSANGDYSDGSIQTYTVDNSGNATLSNVLSIPAHATEFAVSNDSKLVALSFDSSYTTTQVQFYNYTSSTNPTSLPNITLNLPSSNGKQSVKKLGIFKRSGDSSYYVYGTILTFQNDDNTGGNVPPRTFLAKVASNFSTSQLLFVLSYGLNDPSSLAQQSSSLNSAISSNVVQYTFGSIAPTYDATHDLFIAFPTGTIGGYNGSINEYPGLPNPLTYFSGKTNGNVTLCNGKNCQIQPDYRSTSMIVVDLNALITSGNPLNNSAFFVPLGWNQNGMPYASVSKGTSIIDPNNTSNSDKNSFTFQTGFWSSYWANTPNNGAGAVGCFTTAASSNSNQYTVLGDNTLFVVKSGTNGGNDLSSNDGKVGNGNEVMALTGLDILKANINSIRASRGGVISSGESDFVNISKYQIIDPYNTIYNPTLKSSWLIGDSSTQNAGPLTPFMYSRTSNVSNFDTTPTGIGNMSVLNFGSNQCLPYWARNTAVSGSMGRDSAWLTANPVALAQGSNSTYPKLNNDPTQPSVFAFPTASGAQTCTDVFAGTTSTPKIFCVNYLNSSITRYSVSQSSTVFTSY
ncbi:hypothetical protein [Silvanigrella aquatica]|uniref:Lipoprotein n=1 Tax=Silvanigrella aquatica TaxID=1915309 RepID=A0A1L4CWT8_9BACT|nr:hypothetical protein [Silvanigrella aquatica]APJ02408.1 hypothetical protein AXG55_00030 [Silvanigrella aquatica]